MSEHDFESIRGLPGELPEGEHILWQGAPRWMTLAQQAFHVRAVAAYFAGMFALRVVAALAVGQSLPAVGRSILLVSPVAVLTIAVLAGLGWLYSRTTVYTITNKRVVIRFGVALPKAFNIPFAIIDSAAVKTLGGRKGDLALTLKAPEPTLRALADVQSAAEILASAMKDVTPIELMRPAPSRERVLTGVGAHPDAVAA
jgi:hypothetical protein